MTQEGNATFQEVFSIASPTDSIKLLPWHVSTPVPFCHMSKALATAMQQGESIPTTATAPKPEESLAPSHSSSPAHHTRTPLPLIPLLPDIPLVGTPPVGCPLLEFIAGPSSSLTDHCDK